MSDRHPRVLVVDDNLAIHDDIRKVLGGVSSRDEEIEALEVELFGGVRTERASYRVESAARGEVGVGAVQAAIDEADPFAVAFVDVRMPPGWDGIETIGRMWALDPHLQVVICTAHSDHSWPEIVRRLGSTDNLLVLKKPFDSIELSQMAHALARKWALQRDDREKLAQANRDLRHSNTLLEDKSRSLEQAIAELHKAQAKVLRAARLAAVGQLAAGVAHEINNPLTVILGFAESIQRRITADHDFAMPVSAIVRETVRCRDLVRRLSTFARGAGRTTEAVDLREVVASALALVGTRLRAQGIRLVQELADDIEHVHGSAVQLEQVLVDVTNNALDAMPEGGALGIRTRICGDGVCIEVSDTGRGIAEDDLPRVFDPFFTTKSLGQSTGLGLTIAHEVVLQAGGTIDIESHVGGGTRVTIMLVRAAAAA